MLQPGDKLLVVHRRLFPEDSARFFVGKVDAYEAGIASVTGFTWVRDSVQGRLQRKSGERTKIVSLSSGTLMVYRLDTRAPLQQIELRSDDLGYVVLHDGMHLQLDLTEHVHHVRPRA